MGLVLGVAVTPANLTERDGAKTLLGRVLGCFTWLVRVWKFGAGPRVGAGGGQAGQGWEKAVFTVGFSSVSDI